MPPLPPRPLVFVCYFLFLKHLFMFFLIYTAAPATKHTRVTYQRLKELSDAKTAIKMKSGSGFGVTAMETGFKHTFRAAIDNMQKKN